MLPDGGNALPARGPAHTAQMELPAGEMQAPYQGTVCWRLSGVSM